MSRPNRSQNGFAVGLPGEHKAYGTRIFGFDLLEQLRSIHLRHAHVRDDHIERCARQHLERLPSSWGEFHFPFLTHAAQATFQPAQQHWFIIDE
jgi:hypothetical protein